MLAREIENFVDGLFGSSEFSLRLQDRVAVEVEKCMGKWKREITERNPDTMVKATDLVEDIGDTLQQLVDIGLRESLTTEFSFLTEETLRVRSDIEELRGELLSDVSNRKEQMEVLRKSVEEARKRTELRMGVERVQPSIRSKLSRTIDIDSSPTPTATKQEIHTVREQIKQIQSNLRDNQQSQMKHQEDLSMSLKTKLEQNYQKLKKDLITLTTRCDSLAVDRELFNHERLEKAVKRHVDSRLQPLSESVEEHKRFFSCYQQQFSDFERSVKKFLECSLQTIWKVITEIRFQLEQLPYRQEETIEETEKKPQQTSPFGFLFG